MTEHEVITREEAKRRGLKRYFTGKLCKNGHVAERLVSNGTCVECARERSREWKREKQANDPEYVARKRERQREKYANDPEYAARMRERMREKRANDPEYAARMRERNRERGRERDHERMAAGLCVRCGEPAVTKRFCWTCADNHNARRYML